MAPDGVLRWPATRLLRAAGLLAAGLFLGALAFLLYDGLTAHAAQAAPLGASAGITVGARPGTTAAQATGGAVMCPMSPATAGCANPGPIPADDQRRPQPPPSPAPGPDCRPGTVNPLTCLGLSLPGLPDNQPPLPPLPTPPAQATPPAAPPALPTPPAAPTQPTLPAVPSGPTTPAAPALPAPPAAPSLPTPPALPSIPSAAFDTDAPTLPGNDAAAQNPSAPAWTPADATSSDLGVSGLVTGLSGQAAGEPDTDVPATPTGTGQAPGQLDSTCPAPWPHTCAADRAGGPTGVPAEATQPTDATGQAPDTAGLPGWPAGAGIGPELPPVSDMQGGPGPHTPESPGPSDDEAPPWVLMAMATPPGDPNNNDPNGSDPAGSDPTGSNPTGSNPTGSNPTGSESAGTNPAGIPAGSGPTGAGADPEGTDPAGTDPAGALEPRARFSWAWRDASRDHFFGPLAERARGMGWMLFPDQIDPFDPNYRAKLATSIGVGKGGNAIYMVDVLHRWKTGHPFIPKDFTDGTRSVTDIVNVGRWLRDYNQGIDKRTQSMLDTVNDLDAKSKAAWDTWRQARADGAPQDVIDEALAQRDAADAAYVDKQLKYLGLSQDEERQRADKALAQRPVRTGKALNKALAAQEAKAAKLTDAVAADAANSTWRSRMATAWARARALSAAADADKAWEAWEEHPAEQQAADPEDVRAVRDRLVAQREYAPDTPKIDERIARLNDLLGEGNPGPGTDPNGTDPTGTDPTGGPDGTDPTGGPEGTDPTAGPEGTDPITGPEGIDPNGGPEGTDPTTGPEGTDPITGLEGEGLGGDPLTGTGPTRPGPLGGVTEPGTVTSPEGATGTREGTGGSTPATDPERARDGKPGTGTGSAPEGGRPETGTGAVPEGEQPGTGASPVAEGEQPGTGTGVTPEGEHGAGGGGTAGPGGEPGTGEPATGAGDPAPSGGARPTGGSGPAEPATTPGERTPGTGTPSFNESDLPGATSGPVDSFGRGFAKGAAWGAVYEAAAVASDRYYKHLLGENTNWLVQEATKNPQLAQEYLDQYDHYQNMGWVDRRLRDVATLGQTDDYSDPNHQIPEDYFNPQTKDAIQEIHDEQDAQGIGTSGIKGGGPAGNPAVTGSLNGPVDANGNYWDDSLGREVNIHEPGLDPHLYSDPNADRNPADPTEHPDNSPGAAGAPDPSPLREEDYYPADDAAPLQTSADCPGFCADENTPEPLRKSGIPGGGPAGNPHVTSSLDGPVHVDGMYHNDACNCMVSEDNPGMDPHLYTDPNPYRNPADPTEHPDANRPGAEKPEAAPPGNPNGDFDNGPVADHGGPAAWDHGPNPESGSHPADPAPSSGNPNGDFDNGPVADHGGPAAWNHHDSPTPDNGGGQASAPAPADKAPSSGNPNGDFDNGAMADHGGPAGWHSGGSQAPDSGGGQAPAPAPTPAGDQGSHSADGGDNPDPSADG